MGEGSVSGRLCRVRLGYYACRASHVFLWCCYSQNIFKTPHLDCFLNIVPYTIRSQLVFACMCACMLSRIWVFAIPQYVAHQAPLWDSPVKNTGVGCIFLLQGIFPIQGPNQRLLHWQVDSLLLNHLYHWASHGGSLICCFGKDRHISRFANSGIKSCLLVSAHECFVITDMIRHP